MLVRFYFVIPNFSKDLTSNYQLIQITVFLFATNSAVTKEGEKNTRIKAEEELGLRNKNLIFRSVFFIPLCKLCKKKIQLIARRYIQMWLMHTALLMRINCLQSLCEKCLYSQFFWSVLSRIWTEYGEIRSIFLCLV